jgi:hypothetical protein
MVTAKVIIIGIMSISALLTVFSVSHRKPTKKDHAYRVFLIATFLVFLTTLIKLAF